MQISYTRYIKKFNDLGHLQRPQESEGQKMPIERQAFFLAQSNIKNRYKLSYSLSLLRSSRGHIKTLKVIVF